MICKNCGKTVPDGNRFCGYCGTKMETVAPAVPAVPARARRIMMLGHVDHGKTTLTAAILRILSRQGRAEDIGYEAIDRAPELKAGSVVIHRKNVAFNTQRHRYILTDCPSHTDYVKLLICSSTPTDTAVVVVAATDGPMPQTREHVLLGCQLGIPNMAVYLNKCDQVDDEELVDLIEMEVVELMEEYMYEHVPVIRGSALGALNGLRNYGNSVLELLDALDSMPVQPVEKKPFLMRVEDSFTVTGRGTVVTGTVERGAVSRMDEVAVLSGSSAACRDFVAAIQIRRQTVDTAKAGDDVGLILRSGKAERGDVLCAPGTISAHTSFLAQVYVLSRDEGGRTLPFVAGYRPQFCIYPSSSTCNVTLPEGTEMVMPGDHVNLKLDLVGSAIIDEGTRFTLREGGKLVAIGVVTEIEE